MNSFIHRIPFFRLFLALAIGVFVGSQFTIPLSYLIGILLIGLLGIIAFLFISDATKQFNYRWLFGISTLVLFAGIGLFLIHQTQQQTEFPYKDKKSIYLTKITDAPIEKANSILYKVRILNYYANGKTYEVNKRALLYIPKDSTGKRYDFNDKLLVNTAFSSPKANGNPEEFDFGRYLKQHGIAATGYVAKGNFTCVEKSHCFSIRAASSHIRQKLLEVYRRSHIEGDEFAVVAALMLGYNDALTRELMDSYSVTGAMHVLSVSGLHVAIVCAVFYFLLGFMDKKRSLFVAKHLIVIVLLWGFAFLTGLAPAVVRSALMFSLMALGHVVLRKPQIYNTIFFSAFIMLLYDPNYLFDVGFQLSYLAVISIVYFEPKFKALLTIKFKPLKWLWELTCVGVSAQLGTAALGVFYFHRFANFFWLSNIVVVPLSGFIMYAAMALLAVSTIPYLGPITAFVLKWLLITMNGGIRFIEHLPCAAFPMWIDPFQLVVISAALLLLTSYFVNKKYPFLIVGLLFITLFLADNVLRTYQSSQQKEVLVLADTKNTHIAFAEGAQAFAISSDSTHMKQLLVGYAVKNKLTYLHFNNDPISSFAGKHFLVTSNQLFQHKIAGTILPIDYLIIGNKTHATMRKLLHFVRPKTVIIDHTISAWYSHHLKSECDSLHIACLDTKELGAITIGLQ